MTDKAHIGAPLPHRRRCVSVELESETSGRERVAQPDWPKPTAIVVPGVRTRRAGGVAADRETAPACVTLSLRPLADWRS